ncbi:MAG: mechanosensitive ion channel family protein [Lentimicrobiaceae bacterium]|nr:mechanosensitive ion channel family protein [Lentimicrobiaceae bacterium]
MNVDFQNALNQVIEKIESWWTTFVSMLPNMGVAILLLIIFIVLSRLAANTFRKVIGKTSENKALITLFTTIIRYTVLGIGLFIMLSVLKLDKAVTSILAGVGILGLALGFAFQDIAANFISGIILAFRTPFTIGDIIKVNDIMGTALSTNLRTTIVKTFTGQEVFIPNKDVLQNPIVNYTTLGKRRIDISVGISYGDDLDKVQAITLETIKKIDGVIDPDNTVFDYEEFGGSSINFNIRFWISYPGAPGYFKVKTDAIKAIKKAFDDNDIMIPFPIRTLDFGIRGGEPLSAMKLNIPSMAENNNPGTEMPEASA